MKEKLVLIGNGMAGIRTLEELLKLAPEMYEITVFGDEPHGNYNRIMLSPVLAAEKTIDDIILNDRQWYADNNITLHTSKRITRINRGRRTVTAEDGSETAYDRLIISTGSSPFIIPIPGSELEGVIGFRDIQDVNEMLDAASKYKKAVVIGGGLLGLEAADGLVKQGMDVTVVHLVETLMEQQLDSAAGALLKSSLEERGLKFLMEHKTEALLGDRRVQHVCFSNGLQIPADLIVMAVGIRPNIELAESAGIHSERGIVVNDTMQTYDPRIYAVGECAQHRNITYGLVAPLFEQAKVCANQLAQLGISYYKGSTTSTKLKVNGIDLFSAGEFQKSDDTEELLYQDPGRGVYKKIVIRNSRIVGSLLYGDTIDGPWYFQLMRDGIDISEMRERLLFGQVSIGDSGHSATDHIASMPDDTEVCGCNGVCKGDIVNAIIDKGLFTLDEVKLHTKAAASCGSCAGVVEQILASTVGADFAVSPAKRPICNCTEYTHDEARSTIAKYELKDIRAVMDFMEWKTPDGCNRCRPALNYYLLCAWPGEYVDDSRSRFINERVHANIQKDGTYSVIPQMKGGMTNAAELRAIADIADKYSVPEMKVTGGQRIDLFGLKKEQLPEIWADLNAAGMISGHAYGKSLRTVKSCIGSRWCRFGTQDSVTMAVKLEEMSWGSWMPHKFKMAVSGCPRNCAEATIKDLGVVGIDSGWELHIGGNGGVKVRATDLLCKVQTQQEVLEYAAAFMQLYREEAHYLDRTAPWIERVGLTYIKQRLIEDGDGRAALAERFYQSQKYAQIDPWRERVEGKEAHEFTPMIEIVD